MLILKTNISMKTHEASLFEAKKYRSENNFFITTVKTCLTTQTIRFLLSGLWKVVPEKMTRKF